MVLGADNGDNDDGIGPLPLNVLAIRYTLIALSTLTFSEHIAHAHHDWRILRRQLAYYKRSSSTTAVVVRFSDVIFLVARYAVLWYVAVGLHSLFGRPGNCDAVKVNSFVSFLIGSGAVNLLFLYRVWILWARAWWPAAILGGFFVADLVLWIVVAAQSEIASVADVVPGPAPICIMPTKYGRPSVKGYNWLFRMILEGLACVFTLWRVSTLPKLGKTTGRYTGGGGSHGGSITKRTLDMRTWIRFSNLAYFLTASIIYLAGFIGHRFDHRLEPAIIWSNLAQVVPILVGIRIILHTPSRREHEAQEEEEEERRRWQSRQRRHASLHSCRDLLGGGSGSGHGHGHDWTAGRRRSSPGALVSFRSPFGREAPRIPTHTHFEPPKSPFAAAGLGFGGIREDEKEEVMMHFDTLDASVPTSQQPQERFRLQDFHQPQVHQHTSSISSSTSSSLYEVVKPRFPPQAQARHPHSPALDTPYLTVSSSAGGTSTVPTLTSTSTTTPSLPSPRPTTGESMSPTLVGGGESGGTPAQAPPVDADSIAAAVERTWSELARPEGSPGRPSEERTGSRGQR
ncbi:hypothetical protein V8E36_003205 [Tilletia maclaganii]